MMLYFPPKGQPCEEGNNTCDELLLKFGANLPDVRCESPQ